MCMGTWSRNCWREGGKREGEPELAAFAYLALDANMSAVGLDGQIAEGPTCHVIIHDAKIACGIELIRAMSGYAFKAFWTLYRARHPQNIMSLRIVGISADHFRLGEEISLAA
jgi:hypothetical protein